LRVTSRGLGDVYKRQANIYDTIRNETVFSAAVVRDNVPSTIEIYSVNSKKDLFYRLTEQQIKDIITL
jgi:hypothetical protein